MPASASLASTARRRWPVFPARVPSLPRCAAPRRRLVVLAIETSCDDTSAAVVTSSREILSNIVAGQGAHHEPLGGIVPNIATQRHSARLPSVVLEALASANCTIGDIDVVAVTRGPGLPPCLAVGLNAAKTMAAVSDKPIGPVHHMEAHLLTARLAAPGGPDSVPFPFLCLLASGGHTMLVLARSLGDYVRLGSTLDDAVGEAFDKVARDLELPWIVDGAQSSPGAALEALAAKGDPSEILPPLPIPMRAKPSQRTNCDFSFAGLKAAVKRKVQHGAPLSAATRANLAAAFQAAAISHITDRVERGLQWCQPSNGAAWAAPVAPRCLVVSGGVGSNAALRDAVQRVGQSYGIDLICPPASLCTDNAAMIAWAAIEYAISDQHDLNGMVSSEAGALDDGPYGVQIRSRWPLGVDYREWPAEHGQDIADEVHSR